MLNNTNSITDLPSLLQYVQITLGVPFAELTVVSVFIVAFISLKQFESKRAATGAFFIAWLVALTLFFMSVLSINWVYFTLFATALSVLLIND